MVSLEDVGHVGGDVERHVDVGIGGPLRQADRVVEQGLAGPGLNDARGQARQVGEDGTDQRGRRVVAGGNSRRRPGAGAHG